jgi:hypothetical protein|tara:strand:+ start:54 stop:188 length:135 start_codon:yes stop_codon:yes gene_type:complete
LVVVDQELLIEVAEVELVVSEQLHVYLYVLEQEFQSLLVVVEHQ